MVKLPRSDRPIRRSLSDILRSGTLGQRKAIMETHVAEIRVVDDRLIPVYRIPVDTFCARGQVVDRTLDYANHRTAVQGQPLPGSLTRSSSIGRPADSCERA